MKQCKYLHVACHHPFLTEIVDGEKYYPVCICDSDEDLEENCELFEEAKQ